MTNDELLEELNSLSIEDKRNILYTGIEDLECFPKHLKINCDYLCFNLSYECDREIAVSYFPMLPVINKSVPIEEADYIIYGHFYARFHHFRDIAKTQIEDIAKKRKPGAKIIVVGKSCNVKPYIDSCISDILYFESHYAEKIGKYFNLPIKDQYFVYEKEKKRLNIWPVDGCNCHCKFCRRTYMHIPFESLPLDYVKEKLDWYKKNSPEKLENVWLRAENLTEYGLDLYGRQALPELLELLNSYSEIQTITVLIGLAIGEINDEILDALCKCQKLDIVHLNVEAGSDRLLSVIGKKHTVSKAKEVFRRLREAHPDIHLFTNIMLGLPTESIEDIISLADLLSDLSVDGVYMLRYENDPDVELAKLPQLSEKLFFYHLKLLLRLLKQSNLSRKMLINCEDLPSKTRIYVKHIGIIRKNVETLKKYGFDTAYHLRRKLTLYPKNK